ncbi:hypothetical protein [Heyndrickxia sporothermodurans]|uniref:hypothetical protein n=1 Tax=Heyndrickxia sporothermodurans TaxID=46224 RepID=UPI001056ED4E|nr:hypothetical protein [Heyndrickxia sporothermodurans]
MLHKTKKVDELTREDVITISNAVYTHVKSDEDLKSLNLAQITGIEAANEMIPAVKLRGEMFQYYSMLEEVGYWRKANQIHAWFVENVQDGNDDCELYPVSKAKLEKLLGVCRLVLNNIDHAETLLPTRSGFFFGSTDYDEYYKQDVQDTVKILEEVLEKTDFDKEAIYYSSSW